MKLFLVVAFLFSAATASAVVNCECIYHETQTRREFSEAYFDLVASTATGPKIQARFLWPYLCFRQLRAEVAQGTCVNDHLPPAKFCVTQVHETGKFFGPGRDYLVTYYDEQTGYHALSVHETMAEAQTALTEAQKKGVCPR